MVRRLSGRFEPSKKSEGVLAKHAVKMIMTTALSDLDNVVIAVDAHCDAYLLKPIEKATLLDHLREMGFPVECGSEPAPICR